MDSDENESPFSDEHEESKPPQTADAKLDDAIARGVVAATADISGPWAFPVRGVSYAGGSSASASAFTYTASPGSGNNGSTVEVVNATLVQESVPLGGDVAPLPIRSDEGAATAAAAAAAAAVDAMLNDPAALRVDTFRASGKGGQSVNTTDSAVRMTHLPTGIVASYQGERSQHHNRKRCLAVMRAKLAAHIASEEAVARDEHWRDVRTVENAFGGQFRSYTLDTGIVNDHRTGFKCNGAERVLADGRIGPLLVAGLKHRKGGSA